MTPEEANRLQAFYAFWAKLDHTLMAEGKDRAGFEEAWALFRRLLVDEELLVRFMSHAAFGDRDDAYDPEEIIARDRYDNAPDR